jgi:hypothetical protein
VANFQSGATSFNHGNSSSKKKFLESDNQDEGRFSMTPDFKTSNKDSERLRKFELAKAALSPKKSIEESFDFS